MRLRRSAPVLLALALLGAPRTGAAALVRWYFTGRVVEVTGDIGGSSPAKIASLAALGVGPDTVVSGSLAFDSTAPDTQADTAIGEYLGAISDLELRAGGYRLAVGTSPDPQANAFVVATPAAAFGPSLFTSAPGADDPPLAANGALFVLDLSGGALPIASDALPLAPPDFTQAASATFVVVSENEYVVALQLDSLTAKAPAPVPALPSAGAALLVAALALALQTGRMPRFLGGSASSGRAR